jgi:lysophospholipase L1-like esterase
MAQVVINGLAYEIDSNLRVSVAGPQAPGVAAPSSGIVALVAGVGLTVDNSDPQNPVISVSSTPADPPSLVRKPPLWGEGLASRSLRYASNVMPSTVTAAHARIRLRIGKDCLSISPVFGNSAVANGNRAVTVRWSMDRSGTTPASTGLQLGHFAGEDTNRDVVIPVDTEVIGLPVYGPFHAGDVVWLNVRCVSTAGAGLGNSGIPSMPKVSRFFGGESGECGYQDTAASPADHTADPSTIIGPGGGGFDIDVYGPIAVIGRTGRWQPSWCIVGDSIGEGYVDDTVGDGHNQSGWWQRSMDGMVGASTQAKAGENSGQWLADRNRQRQMAQYSHVVDAFGRNDLSTGVNLPALYEQKKRMWGIMRRAGVRVIVGVLPPPKTTTTDTWATTANQTADSGGGPEYEAYCTWILSQVGVSIDAVLDQRAAVATYTGGAWKWNPGYTADGTHPIAPGHIAIAAAWTAQFPFVNGL